jgi:hypothetical protein
MRGRGDHHSDGCRAKRRAVASKIDPTLRPLSGTIARGLFTTIGANIVLCGRSVDTIWVEMTRLLAPCPTRDRPIVLNVFCFWNPPERVAHAFTVAGDGVPSARVTR